MSAPGTAATTLQERIQDSEPIRVVCVDADEAAIDLVARALLHAGMVVALAARGAEGLVLATAGRVDLLLVDLNLPDLSGAEVLAGCMTLGIDTPIVLMGAAVTVESAVDLVKAGAADVIAKPIVVERLLVRVRRLVEGARTRLRRAASIPPPGTGSPRSAAEHWAREVLKASRSDGDLKTLDDWARFAGVSYSSLCEMCRLVGVRPHDARDLVRVLSALSRAARLRCEVDVLLNVRDRRTLRSLLRRAGLDAGSLSSTSTSAGTISVEHFLDRQQFVRPDNEGLRLLRQWLTR